MRIPSGPARVAALGAADRNLKMIREALGVNVTARDALVHLRGERHAVGIARAVLERLVTTSGGVKELSRSQVLGLIADEASRVQRGPEEPVARLGGPSWEGPLAVYGAGRAIIPKSERQEAYLEAIRTHDLVIGIGPAGTGKTYLAVAAAVHMLRIERVRKIVLARPAVEAGEKLGFLPGDIEAKINPYLRPLFDALHDMMDFATIRRFIESDVLEVVPLAFMRGRTLNNAVILLDEAQNTTRGQMQMFLTRMGRDSKAIVTGDVTQIDLPEAHTSGLIDAARRLRRVPGVAFATLDHRDVVRHTLVQRIVEAYAEPSDRNGEEGA
jgi:phosphate starvation-inducible protein PhoH and related proteins